MENRLLNNQILAILCTNVPIKLDFPTFHNVKMWSLFLVINILFQETNQNFLLIRVSINLRHLRLFFTCAIFIAFPLKCELQPSFFDVGVFSTRLFPLSVEFSKASLNFHKNTGGSTNPKYPKSQNTKAQNTQGQNTQSPKITKIELAMLIK